MLQDEAAGWEGICSAMTEILASRSCGWAGAGGGQKRASKVATGGVSVLPGSP